MESSCGFSSQNLTIGKSANYVVDCTATTLNLCIQMASRREWLSL